MRSDKRTSINSLNDVSNAGFPSCRVVLAAMGFLAFFNCYTLRINLSVTIVAMVNTTYLREFDAADIPQWNSTNTSSTSSSRQSDYVCVTDDNTTDIVDNEVYLTCILHVTCIRQFTMRYC